MDFDLSFLTPPLFLSVVLVSFFVFCVLFTFFSLYFLLKVILSEISVTVTAIKPAMDDKSQGEFVVSVSCVCASNMNRSMAAHRALKRAFPADVPRSMSVVLSSYGTGKKVSLPGHSERESNIYDFGTPYSKIREDLDKQDGPYYLRKGLLQMLERNAEVKTCPERWIERDREKRIDLVIAYDERVYGVLVEDVANTGARTDEWGKDVGIVAGLITRDNHEDAADCGKKTVALLEIIENAGPYWKDKLEEIAVRFKTVTDRTLIYTVFPFQL